MTVSQTFLVLKTSVFFRSTCQVVCRMPSVGIFLVFFFSWLDWDHGRKRPQRGKVPFSLHHINSIYCQISPLWSHSFSSFSMLCSLEEVIMHSPQKVKSYVPLLWEWSIYINYLKFFYMGNLSIWTCRYFFYILSYNMILLYLFCCSNWPMGLFFSLSLFFFFGLFLIVFFPLLFMPFKCVHFFCGNWKTF